jgi:hypothetical protein
LLVAARCTVSFSDPDGIVHAFTVQAETLYEAAVLALRAFREHDCIPGPAVELEVEVRGPSVVHKLSVRKVDDWLNSTCRSPRERITKERLKELLG